MLVTRDAALLWMADHAGRRAEVCVIVAGEVVATSSGELVHWRTGIEREVAAHRHAAGLPELATPIEPAEPATGVYFLSNSDHYIDLTHPRGRIEADGDALFVELAADVFLRVVAPSSQPTCSCEE